MTRLQLREYFSKTYPSCGDIFYDHSLDYLTDELNKKNGKITLENITNYIRYDPFILRHIFCIDDFCNNPDKFHGNDPEEGPLCLQSARSEQFRHSFYRARQNLDRHAFRERKKNECKEELKP